MPELRDTNHYADLVALRYPHLDPKAVRRICRYLMRQVSALAQNGEDVLLQSARYAVSFKVFLLDSDVRRHNRENSDRRMKRAQMRARRAYWHGTGTRTRKSDFPLKKIL
ncbi:hypothetical protein [Hymenobacter siberiensis]|uniref:hypothetical protein n=1 Tax=Hymenobacter siberiensis TaxID=2848396 RepID=UPI001C1DDBE3|nr:hypothetical protein [Hymenobacter siberiensis]